MKASLFILVTFIVLNSQQSHKFWAESNMECQICTDAFNQVEKGAIDKLDKLMADYPKLKQLFDLIKDHIPMEGTNICETLTFCNSFFIDKSIVNHQQHIDIINSNLQSTWKAGLNDRFNGATYYEIIKTMGTIVDKKYLAPKSQKKFDDDQVVPTEFNAKTKWPKCASVIGHIRDQANCGSCWAFGTTEAFNDRLCIKNGFTKLLSTADTTGCCGFFSCFSMGCNGGQVGTPWTWFKNTGVVTGGQFGDKTGCYPYTMPQCAHHVVEAGMKDCSKITQVSPSCYTDCEKGNTKLDQTTDKHKAKSSYGLGSISDIQKDLMNYGTVTCAFTVQEDFLSYKSGVYKHLSGSELGGHAIKIIGWGNEDNENYWLVANSWNKGWGDEGQFKIAFGDSGIDSQCHAGEIEDSADRKFVKISV